jgi:outer membrane protein TolC
LEIFQAQAMAAEAEIELAEYEMELNLAREHLDRVLGLDRRLSSYTLTEEPEGSDYQIPTFAQAMEQASNRRFDLQMAQLGRLQAQHSVALAKSGVFKDVNIGVSYEHEADGTNSIGPGIELELPVWDQNRAQVIKSRHQLRQAERKLESLQGRMREEIAGDLHRVRFYQTKTTILEKEIVPLWQKASDHAGKWANAMQLNRIFLLEAHKELLQNQRKLLEARMELGRAIAELERNLGG